MVGGGGLQLSQHLFNHNDLYYTWIRYKCPLSKALYYTYNVAVQVFKILHNKLFTYCQGLLSSIVLEARRHPHRLYMYFVSLLEPLKIYLVVHVCVFNQLVYSSLFYIVFATASAKKAVIQLFCVTKICNHTHS